MAAPPVSVLMTAYNREKYIAEAIESVLASTFTDFELIIVDDFSKDHTLEIAKSYAARDSRVTVRSNERNLGDYHNRNQAASFARGEYLKYLDSDDVIYPHGLDVMVSSMERFPNAALGLARPPSNSEPYPVELTPRQAYLEHFFGGGFLDAGPTGAILRRSAFRAMHGFSGMRYLGDAELWLKLGARWPVVKLVQGLIWWRQHAEQEIVFGRNDPATAATNYLLIAEALAAPECPLSAVEKRSIYVRVRRSQARMLLRRCFKPSQARSIRDVMRAIGFGLFDLRHAFSRS